MSSKPWWTVITAREIFQLRTRLMHVVTESLGDAASAEQEDLVQHALLALIRNKERVLPDDDGLFRYARRVVKNAVLDQFKSASHRLSSFDASEGIQSPETESAGPSDAEKNEEILKVRKIFRQFDVLDRLVLWSYVVDGRSINAISKQLDISRHQVAHIIDQTLKHFRQHFS